MGCQPPSRRPRTLGPSLFGSSGARIRANLTVSPHARRRGRAAPGASRRGSKRSRAWPPGAVRAVERLPGSRAPAGRVIGIVCGNLLLVLSS
ncbi:hypothetical protein GQ55_2G463000 [Panicum hallii var. hallii]|uniref:Uncharacterized protein n=1 Tax=Panicum hallii var. hallii TaxID=1504633 RepID=A0A2T7EZN8_9POAL|nr:hypothetical protein GQ55_2G463000 [Panicum hallii var. hallii]